MPRIETRVSESEKQAWKNFCEVNGLSEAAMLKFIIEKVSGGHVDFERRNLKEKKSNKITLRLTDNEMSNVMEMAKQDGFFNKTEWVYSIVKNKIHKGVILNHEETALLRESNRQIAALGRNLNQIARKLNIEFRESDLVSKQMIESIVASVNQHKAKVERLISGIDKKWRG